MKASIFQFGWILLKSIYVTLRITVITLYEVYTGKFIRTEGDQRLRWWSKKLLEFVRMDCQVFNPYQFEFHENRPYIIMCNHSSYYDIPITFISLPGSIRMLTKKELFRVPLWGRGMKVAEFIPIHRHHHAQALKDLESAREKMESGIILWIAPEGTRSLSGDLQPFKKGGFMLALQTKATILPIGIRGANQVLPAHKLDLMLDQQIEVHIGQPIETSEYEISTRDQLMQKVENQIRELAALPKSGKENHKPNS